MGSPVIGDLLDKVVHQRAIPLKLRNLHALRLQQREISPDCFPQREQAYIERAADHDEQNQCGRDQMTQGVELCLHVTLAGLGRAVNIKVFHKRLLAGGFVGGGEGGFTRLQGNGLENWVDVLVFLAVFHHVVGQGVENRARPHDLVQLALQRVPLAGVGGKKQTQDDGGQRTEGQHPKQYRGHRIVLHISGVRL